MNKSKESDNESYVISERQFDTIVHNINGIQQRTSYRYNSDNEEPIVDEKKIDSAFFHFMRPKEGIRPGINLYYSPVYGFYKSSHMVNYLFILFVLLLVLGFIGFVLTWVLLGMALGASAENTYLFRIYSSFAVWNSAIVDYNAPNLVNFANFNVLSIISAGWGFYTISMIIEAILVWIDRDAIKAYIISFETNPDKTDEDKAVWVKKVNKNGYLIDNIRDGGANLVRCVFSMIVAGIFFWAVFIGLGMSMIVELLFAWFMIMIMILLWFLTEILTAINAVYWYYRNEMHYESIYIDFYQADDEKQTSELFYKLYNKPPQLTGDAKHDIKRNIHYYNQYDAFIAYFELRKHVMSIPSRNKWISLVVFWFTGLLLMVILSLYFGYAHTNGAVVPTVVDLFYSIGLIFIAGIIVIVALRVFWNGRKHDWFGYEVAIKIWFFAFYVIITAGAIYAAYRHSGIAII